jgi:hypothetical protein
MTDEDMMDRVPKLRRAIRAALELDPYLRPFPKSQWPLDKGFSVTEPLPPGNLAPDYGVEVRTYSLKHAALRGPFIDPDTADENNLDLHDRALIYNIRCMWHQVFERSYMKLCTTRYVVRELPPWSSLMEFPMARRINLFGKEVPPLKVTKGSFGSKYTISRKYRRAARQVIYFHPNVVEFQFPDLEAWSAQVYWRHNPDGPDERIGYFRAVLTYAAKPGYTYEGAVFTVLPKGIRGLIWGALWRLFGFTP